MKKIIFIILFIFCISSCRSIDYADKYYNVKWSSSDPILEFNVKSKEEVLNDNGFNEGFLIVNDEKIEIICLWTLSNGLDIYYKDRIDNENLQLSEDDLALNGSYKMKNNNVILTINVDNIYNNSYDTITLSMSSLN